MEDKYMLKDPGLLNKDSLYSKYGHVAICGWLQDEYGRLYKTKDWPVLTSSLESNVTTVTTCSEKKKRCHEFGSKEYLRDKYPLLGCAPNQKQSSNITLSEGNSSSATSSSNLDFSSSTSGDPSVK